MNKCCLFTPEIGSYKLPIINEKNEELRKEQIRFLQEAIVYLRKTLPENIAKKKAYRIYQICFGINILVDYEEVDAIVDRNSQH